MAHILSVSYDPTLLMTRELLLQQMGHTVTSVEGFARAFAACESGTKFDFLILGHSIPHDDKGKHCHSQENLQLSSPGTAASKRVGTPRRRQQHRLVRPESINASRSRDV
jgi:CheY-like chemotaxis protein